MFKEDYHALAGLAQKCIEIEKYRFETCIVVGKIIISIIFLYYLFDFSR